jgi:hypothetical protein
MAKPTDPKQTAGVSASVAVAPAVSGDGACGRESEVDHSDGTHRRQQQRQDSTAIRG